MTDKITFARSLRRNPTPAEQAFWAILYPWRDAGMHWRRQSAIGPYVVDFCCRKRKVIVEIDGDSHYFDDGIGRDTVRTAFLEARVFVCGGSAMMMCWAMPRECSRWGYWSR